MTGGGNLPGPLYYIFLSISQMFSFGWVSAWVMQYILAVMAGAGGTLYFYLKGSRVNALMWIILFSLAPFTFNYLAIFLNVSSMIIFTVFSLVFIQEVYDKKNSIETKNKAYLWASFIIGLGLQFHFSIICYFIAMIILNILSKKLDLYSVPKKVIAKGVVFFLIPSIPYLTWILFIKLKLPFGVPSFYSGESTNAPLSLLHLMSFGDQMPLSNVIINIMFGLVPFPMLILLPIHFLFFRDINKLAKEELKNKMQPLIVCLIISSLPVIELFFSPQAARYTLPFMISVSFTTLYLYDYLILSTKKVKIFNFIGIIIQLSLWIVIYHKNSNQFKSIIVYCFILMFFLITLILIIDINFRKRGNAFLCSFALMISLTHTQKSLEQIGTFRIRNFNMPRYALWKKIWTSINRETGWSYDQARTRIFYIGHHLEQAPELVLTDFKNEIHSRPIAANVPDGFFVSIYYRASWQKNFGPLAPAKYWIMKQNMQPEVLQSVKNGDIRLGENISNEILITPYWITNKNNIPQHFHNLGEGYRLSFDDKILGTIQGTEGVKSIGSNKYLFKWNENPDQNEFSSTGAIIELWKKDDFNYLINIKIIGSTLSQITPWVAPNWTQAWIAPYLELKCGNNERKQFSIASSIGFNRSNSQDVNTPILQGNNSFVGPFERRFEFSCKNGIKEIGLGRSGSFVEMITRVKKLPEKYLKINI